MSNTLHTAIYEAVRQRGYLDGYTDAQLLARQVCKLQEEIAEFCREVVLPVTPLGNVKGLILGAGLSARQLFDRPSVWDQAGPIDHPETAACLYQELADLYVVLALIEQTLQRLYPTVPIDMQQLALIKAESDIARGVRSVTQS